MDQIKTFQLIESNFSFSKSYKRFGTGKWKYEKINPRERIIRKWAHRSIVSIKNIQRRKIDYDNIWSKRPGMGIPSYKMKNIIGRIAEKY